MMKLRELQAAFRADILRDGTGAAPLVLGDGLAPEARLRIYRNNSLITLTEALKATFPVVCRLVDERFFAYAADAFIRAHPPRAPCLAEYGGDFAAFLEGFPAASSLAYLPDVARLEWALNEAYHALDSPPLDPARIAAVPAERQAGLRLALHPAVRLFSSRFPIDRIWETNRASVAEPGTVDLDAGGCALLIHRAGIEVRYRPLEAGAFAFLAALAAGRTLEEACGEAEAVGSGFDLTGALHDALALGLFADLTPPA
jgi:hypothetical protein